MNSLSEIANDTGASTATRQKVHQHQHQRWLFSLSSSTSTNTIGKGTGNLNLNLNTTTSSRSVTTFNANVSAASLPVVSSSSSSSIVTPATPSTRHLPQPYTTATLPGSVQVPVPAFVQHNVYRQQDPTMVQVSVPTITFASDSVSGMAQNDIKNVKNIINNQDKFDPPSLHHTTRIGHIPSYIGRPLGLLDGDPFPNGVISNNTRARSDPIATQSHILPLGSMGTRSQSQSQTHGCTTPTRPRLALSDAVPTTSMLAGSYSNVNIYNYPTGSSTSMNNSQLGLTHGQHNRNDAQYFISKRIVQKLSHASALPMFCRLLSEGPTVSNASNACSLLVQVQFQPREADTSSTSEYIRQDDSGSTGSPNKGQYESRYHNVDNTSIATNTCAPLAVSPTNYQTTTTTTTTTAVTNANRQRCASEDSCGSTTNDSVSSAKSGVSSHSNSFNIMTATILNPFKNFATLFPPGHQQSQPSEDYQQSAIVLGRQSSSTKQLHRNHNDNSNYYGSDRSNLSSNPTATINSIHLSTPRRLAASLFPFAAQQQQQQQKFLSAYPMSPSIHNKNALSPATTGNHSNLLFEQEWDQCTTPFLLFASAQVIFYDMQQVRTSVDDNQNDDDNSNSSMAAQTPNVPPPVTLIALFEACIQEMIQLQEELCDPFLSSTDRNRVDVASRKLISSSDSRRYGHGASPTTFNDSGVPDEQQQQQHRPASSIQDAAVLLETALRHLVAILQAQCGLVELQVTLFRKYSDDNDYQIEYDQAAATIASLLCTVIEETKALPDDPPSAAEPIVKNFVRELTAWKYCLEGLVALERCQFVDLVLSIRQWQLHLPDIGVQTRWAQWMRKSYAEVTKLMPVYMDRIRTSAGPLYNFDVQALWNNRASLIGGSDTVSPAPTLGSWDTAVLEFLSNHHALGGPDTAVLILLDADATDNHHIERGFHLSPTTPAATPNVTVHKSPCRAADNLQIEDVISYNRSLLMSMPAIYLRSTMHLPSSLILPIHRNSLRSFNASGSLAPSSSSNLISIWSSSASQSPRGLGKTAIGSGVLSAISHSPKTRGKGALSTHDSPTGSFTSGIGIALTSENFRHHILEYAPDSGTVSSWPHNEWYDLVSCVETIQDEYDDDVQNQQTSEILNHVIGRSENRIVSQKPTKIWWFLSMDKSDNNDPTTTGSPSDLQSILNQKASTEPSDNRNGSPTTFVRRSVSRTTKSSFYYASIGKWLKLVVMIKDDSNCDDDGGGGVSNTWTRRFKNHSNSQSTSRGLSESDICAFVRDSVSKLCVATLLFSDQTFVSELSTTGPGTSTLQNEATDPVPLQQPAKIAFGAIIDSGLNLPIVRCNDNNPYDVASAFWSDEEIVDTFLTEVKRVFGLRHRASSHEPSSLQDSFRSYLSINNNSNFNSGSARSSPTTTPRSARRRMLQHIRHQEQLRQRNSIRNPFSFTDAAVTTLFMGPDLAGIFE